MPDDDLPPLDQEVGALLDAFLDLTPDQQREFYGLLRTVSLLRAVGRDKRFQFRQLPGEVVIDAKLD